MFDAIQKSDILIEALPYIQAFKDRIVVIKYGGSTIEDKIDQGVLRDICFMAAVGMRPIVVHGGGKHISSSLKSANIESEFIQGLRVTDAKAIKVVEDVLVNQVNASIVAKLCAFGCKAKSLSGKTKGMVRVEKMTGFDESGNQVDWGYVGRVKRINARPLYDLLLEGCVPVVAPIGVDDDGQVYNVNADTTAAEIASSLAAEKLVYLTDVPGVLRNQEDPATLISSITVSQVPSLIENEIIRGGMLPKVEACLGALRNSVHKTHIISGKMAHSLLLEIFTEQGIGTQFLN